MTTRVALLGAGDFGQLHARVLADLPGVELAAICDPDGARAARLGSQLDAHSTTDIDGVLADPTVGAVVIASPEAFHVPQAEAALRAGKHAFVEKPVALTTGEALHLAGLARACGTVLMPGHILRFVPAYAMIRQIVASRTRVHSAFARRNVPSERFALHQRTHTVYMSLTHDLDLLLWYLEGQTPERVYAVERRTIPGEGFPDVFWGLIEFSGGTVACVESLWTIPAGGGRYVEVELELSTDRGMLTIRNPDEPVTIVDDRKSWHPDTVIDVRADGYRSGALRDKLTHFIAQIERRAAPVVTIEDAVRATALAEALLRAARERAPITIDPDTFCGSEPFSGERVHERS